MAKLQRRMCASMCGHHPQSLLFEPGKPWVSTVCASRYAIDMTIYRKSCL